ncbi:MAG: nitrilase-related carbon-nitrogen hydrolase [Acidobacteriota bacterium]|nr:nitrilase-related carbon-nitrogen hydrolase [Acidobacteriota bacterium]
MARIGLIQMDIQWEDAEANIRRVDELTRHVKPGDFDMLILPELWSCGFTMNDQAYATWDIGHAYMASLSKKLNCLVLGGLPRKVDNGQENRCYLLDGENSRSYTKIKTFTFAGEDKKYQRGNPDQKQRWDVMGFQLTPFICYDLRFPEMARAMVPDSTLFTYVACWPIARELHWRQLLRARAIENLAYVIGVNRVGRDGAGLDYPGASMVIGPTGEIVLDAGTEEGFYEAEIDPAQVAAARDRFRFLDDM